jgi:hypothetical protein
MGTLADEAKQYIAEIVGAAADVVRLGRSARNYIADLLIIDQLNAAGLEIEPGTALTPEVIAEAMRAKIEAEYGIDVGNILDADSVKRSLRTEALRLVAERLGVEPTQAGIAREMRSQVSTMLRDAVANGDADVLQAVGLGESRIEEALRAASADEWPTPISNFSEKAEKSRERQARYRASHKRVWVEK